MDGRSPVHDSGWGGKPLGGLRGRPTEPGWDNPTVARALPRIFEPRLLPGESATVPEPKHPSLDPWARHFLESSPDPQVAFARSGRIMSINAAAGDLLGLAGGELLEQPIGLVLPSLNLETLRSGARLKLDARRSDGTTLPVQLTVTPLQAGGDVGFLGRLEAASPSHTSDTPLAAILREEFLMTLSHELRSPLQSILSWAQLLRSTPADDPMTVRGLDAIERNIRWQVEVIDDVLELSQLSGDLRMQLRPIRMSEIIEKAVAEIFETARLRGIRLTRSLDADERTVAADPHWLGRVVRTLLANSLKFTSEGGSIDVDLRRMGRFMQLTIADTSPGPDGELHRPHDAFRHGNPSATGRFHGLGVALVKVQRVIELHGGEVHAESAGLGRGVSFGASLPISSAE
jgi:PAS domain S-box-containing protein